MIPPELLLIERFLQHTEERGAYLADTDGDGVKLLEPRQIAALLWQWYRAGMPGPKTVEV